ncbi:hypothetical protein [Mycobacterium sp. shizuoka-1]|uniref:hypothetical protein n=1 Tax=Mycobacterium sp. shizuoka-1 TaxID=2039281 RepID=UPI001E636323|nr:hypothetical protein [Mycobacterium sp. shizuoka-1]
MRGWDTTHLTEAASHWTKTATIWEDTFTQLSQSINNPGGTPWLGHAADAAQHRAYTDRLAVIRAADQLHSASAAARTGADEIRSAKEAALSAVERAEQAGFAVGEDFSIRSRKTGSPAMLAARQAQVVTLGADIRARVSELIAADQHAAGKIAAAAEGLDGVNFTDRDATPEIQKPSIQMVDNHEGRDQSPQPPARGLPPEGVQPPVEGPLTPGPASRPSEAGKGGQSLWDKDGGEWRYFPGDKWHNPHWDYNGHANPKSPWDNIPIDDLPPRIVEAPPIISGLPPWLLSPATPGVPGQPQNPLLTPFPGATMPSPAPAPAPAPGAGLMPHIEIGAPSSGDLQTASGETAMVGGGALLLLIIGAMALA